MAMEILVRQKSIGTTWKPGTHLASTTQAPFSQTCVYNLGTPPSSSPMHTLFQRESMLTPKPQLPRNSPCVACFGIWSSGPMPPGLVLGVYTMRQTILWNTFRKKSLICHLIHDWLCICLKSDALWERACTVNKGLHNLNLSIKTENHPHSIYSNQPSGTQEATRGPSTVCLLRPLCSLIALSILAFTLILNKIPPCFSLCAYFFNSLNKMPSSWKHPI